MNKEPLPLMNEIISSKVILRWQIEGMFEAIDHFDYGHAIQLSEGMTSVLKKLKDESERMQKR